MTPERHASLALDSNMQVDVEKHERPQQDSQEKGQEIADGMDRVSVSKRYHYTDDYVQETEYRNSIFMHDLLLCFRTIARMTSPSRARGPSRW
jgi:hypothetical protein